jgi:chromosome segregation ATPase
MPDLQDLYNQLQTTCTSIDNAKNALAAQLSSANPTQKQQIQSEILSLSIKEGQLQGAFIQSAMQSSDIQTAITSISNITNNLNQAVQQLTNVNNALQTASQVLGYVIQIIGIIAPFL